MKKIICLVLAFVLAASVGVLPVCGAETGELETDTYYDAALLFSDGVEEKDGFIMTAAQKKIYDTFGESIFGVPVLREDGMYILPEKSAKSVWDSSVTKTFDVNIASPGAYSVNILACEYNSRGFQVTMTGLKADGTSYSETYLTNYKNGENTVDLSGQEKIGFSLAENTTNLGIHYARFYDLAEGIHTLTITYSGDEGKAVTPFYGINICKIDEILEDYVTISSCESVDGVFTYYLNVPNSVLEKGYSYTAELLDNFGELIGEKSNEPWGRFENVDGGNYILRVYTKAEGGEIVGTDEAQGYAELDISAVKGADIDENMIGLFYEDISYGADGGLYAELIENRSFEQLKPVFDSAEDFIPVENTPEYAWTVKKGNAEYLTDEPLNENNTHYVRLKGGAAGAELYNQAYEGIYLEADKAYNISVWAKTGSYKGGIKAEVSKGRNIYLSGVLKKETETERSDGWAKYSARVIAKDTVSKADFTISLPALGADDFVCLDMISMIPADAVYGVFRKDLAQAVKELKPKFLRFPGGCAVEGYNLEGRYRWKDSVGAVEERKQSWNRWAYKQDTYNMTYGLGFYEYFLLCEYLDCLALPVLNAGMACEYNTSEVVPLYEDDGVTYTAEFMEYIQDALDLIEFANGDETTKWGALRAEMGHPEPFNLTMLGIGNEQWEKDGNMWYERYEAFEKEIHKVYPEIGLIASAGPDISSSKYVGAWEWIRESSKNNPSFAYAVDEHNYNTVDWFFDNDDFYDGYSRDIPVYIGEYAAKSHVEADGKKYSNDMISALSEAAFMTGVERNADVVKMASYAPLFSRSKPYSHWGPDMIWFNDTTLYKTPNYYVQKLLGENMGSYTLEAEMSFNGEERLYQVSSFDEETGDIIIKAVNPSEKNITLNINIDGGFKLEGTAKVSYIASDEKTASNSFEKPFNVSEQTETVSDVSNNFGYGLKPYSYTIIRISTR